MRTTVLNGTYAGTWLRERAFYLPPGVEARPGKSLSEIAAMCDEEWDGYTNIGTVRTQDDGQDTNAETTGGHSNKTIFD